MGQTAAPTKTVAKPASYQPAPAIWRLADADTTIYLFGTIHALPKEVKWRSKALDDIIDEVDELVVETSDKDGSSGAQSTKNDSISGGESTPNFLDDKMEAAMLAGLDRKPLLERIQPENREILQQLVKELDLPMDYLDLLPTWMVPFAVFYDSADEAGVSPELGVENVLEARFEKAKKPISGIENADAVDASLNALSDAEQLVSLDQMLTEIRTAEAISLKPVPNAKEVQYADDIAWAKGDISNVGNEMSPATMGPAFYKALLVDRNRAWTGWLKKRLEKPGKILVAVGSAHLAGVDSVQTMLTGEGLTVERIH